MVHETQRQSSSHLHEIAMIVAISAPGHEIFTERSFADEVEDRYIDLDHYHAKDRTSDKVKRCTLEGKDQDVWLGN